MLICARARLARPGAVHPCIARRSSCSTVRAPPLGRHRPQHQHHHQRQRPRLGRRRRRAGGCEGGPAAPTADRARVDGAATRASTAHRSG
eukprot:scaffold2058_cov403-Prasinococcus_capsulatus_cf.AAC.7